MSGVSIPAKPNYQVPFAEQVKVKADIPVTAVGLITKPKRAAKILASAEADAVDWPRRFARSVLAVCVRPTSWSAHRPQGPLRPQYVAGAY